MKILDCNQSGILLENGKTIQWEKGSALLKCMYPGRNLPFSLYYLCLKNEQKPIRIKNLGGISLFNSFKQESLERSMLLKLLNFTSQQRFSFFIKQTHFGKKRKWDIEEEKKEIEFYNSDVAEKHRIEYLRNLKIIGVVSFVLIIMFSILVLLKRLQ